MATIDISGATWEAVTRHAETSIAQARRSLESAVDFLEVARLQARILTLRELLDLAKPKAAAGDLNDDPHHIPV